MSAPGSAYTGQSFEVKQTGVIQHNNPVAKYLSEYNGQAHGYFYFDFYFEVKQGSNTGFIGLIKDDPSALFYRLHSPARLGTFKVKSPANGQWYIAFNDAGLNTLCYTFQEQINSTVIWNMSAKANFRGAYFEGSSAFGFRFRIRNDQGSGWFAWDTYNLQPSRGAISAKSNRDETSPGFTTVDRRPIQVQAYITNGEGTFYGEPVEITPTAQPIQFYLDPVTYYIDAQEVARGVKLYDTIDFGGYHQGPTGSGDYAIDDRYYWTYGYDVESNTYMFLELIDKYPPQPILPPIFSYRGYSQSSQNDANNQVLGNAQLYMGDLCLNEAENRWYTGYSGTYPNFTFSGTPDDGYYASGDVSQITGELHLIDGYPQ